MRTLLYPLLLVGLWLVLAIALCACHSGKSREKGTSSGKDSFELVNQSKALNTLSETERHENIHRVNRKVIEKLENRFDRFLMPDSATTLIRHRANVDAPQGVWLEFSIYNGQPKDLYICLVEPVRTNGQHYLVTADNTDFALVNAMKSDSLSKTGKTIKYFRTDSNGVIIDAITHATSVELAYQTGNSRFVQPIHVKELESIRETYEYYNALLTLPP